MNKINDISNLLTKFGGGKCNYLEVENATEYKEDPPAKPTIPAITAAPVPPVQKMMPDTQHITEVHEVAPREGRVEPVMNIAPDVPVETKAASFSSDTTSASSVALLRSLMREAALKREAQMRAENDKASQQAAGYTEKPATPARVIAVVSANGGVGKTTICAALAEVLSRHGHTVAIDLDAQNALQYHLDVNADEAQQKEGSQTENNWQTLLHHGINGIRILPYSAVAQDGVQVLSRHIREDKHWLAGQLAQMHLDAGDIVLLDTPAGQNACLEQVLDVADQVVVVVTPDAGSFIAFNQLDDLLKDCNNDSYIMNKFDASRTFCQDMLEVFKRRVGSKLIGVVSLDHAVDEGLAYGVNPLMEESDLPVRQEILAAGEVLASILQGERVS